MLRASPVSGWRLWCDALARLLLHVALCLPIAFTTHAAEPIKLDDRTSRIDVWPNVTLLFDEQKTMKVDEVIAALPRFRAPESSYSTLGLRKDAVWLRIPVAVDAGSDGHWILDIDYPPLNYVDIYLVKDGREVQRAQLGSLLPFESRPLLSRSHAAPLALQAGQIYDVLIRVESRGAMILPIKLERQAAFYESATGEQMIQGLLIGIALCLLIYSLSQWVSTREAQFLKYALLVSGSLLFTTLQLGVGAQYLWTNNLWIELHMAGLSSLAAIGGTFLFLEEAVRVAPTMDVAAKSRIPAFLSFARIMKGGAILSAVLAVVYSLDIFDTRVLTTIITVLGPLPSLICIPRFVKRARSGDAVGFYLLFAWTAYLAAVVTITAVIRGQLPVNFWTLHSFQFGATFDMLAFLYVLTLRTKAVRLAAQHASMERDIMRALAHTDPLTGLSNRRSLSDALTRSLAGSTADRLLAVYLIDVDEFKPVNDTYGHEAGDELLVEIARRLQASVRSGDIVARLGGDEFVVLANGLRSEQQALELGNKLLGLFHAPVALKDKQVHIGLTIGYAIAPIDGHETSTVLKRADAAMYVGKQNGKRRLQRAFTGNAGTAPLAP